MKEDAENYESYLCWLLFNEYLKTVMLGTILVKEAFILTKKKVQTMQNIKKTNPAVGNANVYCVPTMIRNLLNLQQCLS